MALTAAKQHPIPKQESKGHPQIDFLVVVMASSIACGCILKTTMAMVMELCKMTAMLQLIG